MTSHTEKSALKCIFRLPKKAVVVLNCSDRVLFLWRACFSILKILALDANKYKPIFAFFIQKMKRMMGVMKKTTMSGMINASLYSWFIHLCHSI